MHDIPSDALNQINDIEQEKPLFYSLSSLVFDKTVIVEIDFSSLKCERDKFHENSFRCVFNCKIIKWCNGIENVNSELHVPLKTFVRSLREHGIDIKTETRILFLVMRKYSRIGKGTKYKLKILDCKEVANVDSKSVTK